MHTIAERQPTTRPAALKPAAAKPVYSATRRGHTIETAVDNPNWNFAVTPVRSAQISIQAKLEIGAVDDPLEREADAVADRVMRMPDSQSVTVGGREDTIRRKSRCVRTGRRKGESLPQGIFARFRFQTGYRSIHRA